MHTHRFKVLGAYLFLTAICYWFVSFPAYATSRGIMLKAKTASGAEKEIRLYSGYYALVIGCGDYNNGWPSLPNPVKDAMEVASLLNSMGWTVDVLKNPDGNTFQRKLNKLVAGPGRNRDIAILLWFSGHGHTIEEADGTRLGYLVPVDAPDPDKDLFGFLERSISMRRIETVSKQIRSKHVLMAFDSCFSGAIFQMVRNRPSPYIQEKVSYPVRQFITAGMENEQVPDKSVFKDVFIQGIKEGFADLNRDSYVTAQELGAYLQEKVTNYSRRNQHPQFGKINNPKLDKGDFVFVLKGSQPSSQSDNRIASVLEAEKKRLAEEAARIEHERQELDELKALIEQRKKLEAESRKLEIEKQAVVESSRKKRKIQTPKKAQTPKVQTPKIQTSKKIQTPGSEKQKLAYIPKDIKLSKVSLRKEPKILSRQDIKKMLKKYHFFDKEQNPSGNFANDFIVNQDGTITDRVTGLMWQESGSSRHMLRKQAIHYVKKLNKERFAGYSDWRLPTIDELASLLMNTKKRGVHINMVFNSSQTRCWSADSLLMMSNEPYQEDWIISYYNGHITEARWVLRGGSTAYLHMYTKDEDNYVRAVRSLK